MISKISKGTGIILAGVFGVYLNTAAAGWYPDNSFSGEKANIVQITAKRKNTADVLATVNEEPITRQEVDNILNKYRNQIPEEQIPAITRQIVEGMIAEKLILQFIKVNKIETSDAAVEAELDKVREDIKSNPDLAGRTLEQILESHGGSIENLRRDVKISLSLEKYFSKDLSDDTLKEYFEENKSVYDGTEVKASHILVDTRNIHTEEELKKAKEKILKAESELKEGKDFAKVASSYSDCPSAKKGGDLGFFKRKGQLVEPFAEAAFKLKIGEISKPVKTQFGYHLIKVTDIKKGEVAFKDVKQDIRDDILKERVNNLVAQLKKDAKITIYSDL